MDQKQQDKAGELVTNILKFLEVPEDVVSYSYTGDTFKVQVNLPDDQSGVFIGYHGETISSLQLILGLVISQRLGDWHRVEVNIGDYQERRKENIVNLADNAVNRVLATGKEVMLPNLTPAERRLVHMHLADHPQVSSESRGQDPYRQLMIVPKVDVK